MIIDNQEISEWESKFRLKFINSLSGYKGVHLIGSKGNSENSNVAIFNSVVHISSEPPQIGFIMRPLTVPRHTYSNIIETKSFTINHVHESFLEQAHYTSAKTSEDNSEFNLCNLQEQYLKGFDAPFVAQSTIKIALKLVDDIPIKASGCRLIIGEVSFIEIEKDYISTDGQLDLSKAHNVCVTGLNQYSKVNKLENYEYARELDIPNFYKSDRPDNVVYDEKKKKYHASILPYGTNVGAPKIVVNNLSSWKSKGVNSFNHILKSKVDTLKNSYEDLIDEYNINELLYTANYSFEPVVGEVYHLYSKESSEENFLSLISPQSWNRKCLGSFVLGNDKMWLKISDAS
jgi:flavin reductase (DIM6/NTAB) family NADH-FMN oxidoreductase RutF